MIMNYCLNKMKLLEIDKNINYRNFGYIPTGKLKNDIVGKLFGFKNLYKRLQAKNTINFINIKSDERILDFGCGVGYFSIEFAKIAKSVVAIDINEFITKIKVPNSLKDKLSFTLVRGEKLPFKDSSFDVIYMSEVLPMIADPKEFLSEAKRVLSKNGRIIISNNAGHPKIREYFSKRSGFLWKYANAKYKQKIPKSYEEYENILQKSFKTAQSKFLLLEDIQEMLNELDISITNVDYTPKSLAGTFFSWTQYLNYLKNGETYAQHRFVAKYFLLSFLSLFESKKHFGGLLIEAKKKEKKIFAPFDVNIYDNFLSEIKSKYNVLEYPTTFEYIQNINFLLRHDIDTLECIKSFEYLLEIDKKHNIKSGVYFRVDNKEYALNDYKNKILKYKNAGFEIGLHTVCYVEDDYKKRFFEELDEFEKALGFRATSFTVHGLGEYKLDNRNLFYDDVAKVGLNKYDMSFSDCCRKYMVYDKYIIDCNFDEQLQQRYINDDWFDLKNRLDNEHTVLVMTHPCYWISND